MKQHVGRVGSSHSVREFTVDRHCSPPCLPAVDPRPPAQPVVSVSIPTDARSVGLLIQLTCFVHGNLS